MSTSDPVQRLFNRVTDKIADGIIQASLNILAMLVRPMAIVTEIFFRRDMGERYFTPLNAAFGFFLLLLFSIPIGVPGAEKAGFDALGQFHAAQSAAPRVVLFVMSFAWILSLFAAYGQNVLFIRRNYVQGNRWHSCNIGIPRFPNLPVWLEKLIPFVAAVAFYFLFHLPGLAILLVFSGIVSLLLRAHEARMFRERVLDLIDGQIEQEYVATAVLERAKPQQVDGLRAPLPAYVSRTYRTKIVDALGERLAPNPFIQPASPQLPPATPSAAAPAANPFTTPAAPASASPPNTIKPISQKPTNAAPNASARFLTEAPTVNDPSLTQFTFAKPQSSTTTTSPAPVPTPMAAPMATLPATQAEFGTPSTGSPAVPPSFGSTDVPPELKQQATEQLNKFLKENSVDPAMFSNDLTLEQMVHIRVGIEQLVKKLNGKKITQEDLIKNADLFTRLPENPPKKTKRKS